MQPQMRELSLWAERCPPGKGDAEQEGAGAEAPLLGAGPGAHCTLLGQRGTPGGARPLVTQPQTNTSCQAHHTQINGENSRGRPDWPIR